MQKIKERFWAKVIKTDSCWLWTAGKNKGYGAFALTHKQQKKAHRFSWEMENGPVPKNLQVCHRCDNPLCVRPDHLFLGSHDENHRDKVEKGRSPKGSRSGRTFLTENDVLDIRHFAKDGWPSVLLAELYHIKKETIDAIRQRKTWTHL